MRRGWLLVMVVCLMLPAAVAAQPGINIGWQGATAASACPTNPAALVDASDLCDNSGSHMLVGSVVAPAGLTQVTGEEIYTELYIPESPTLPDFWRMEVGGCRNGSVLMEAVFSGFSTGTAATQCSNYWGSAASGGFIWQTHVQYPNRARFDGVFARIPSTATAMVEGRQYYVFRAFIDGLKAAPDPGDPGAPVCAGCTSPGCFVFNSLILTQPVGNPNGNFTITTPNVRNVVTWQGGPSGTCFISTRPRTWGQLKSMYR